MKTVTLPFLFCTVLCFSSLSQVAIPASAPTIIEKGPNHRVWQTLSTAQDSMGNAIILTNQFTELQTGLYFKVGDV